MAPVHHSHRQLWFGLALGIAGLIVSYTLSLLIMSGPEVFAASNTCGAKTTCTGTNCAKNTDCKDGKCNGGCPGCAGKKS